MKNNRNRILSITLIAAAAVWFLANAFLLVTGEGKYPKINHLSGDQYWVFYPNMVFAKDTVLNGSLPLWNPFQSTGEPSLAGLQCVLLYPFNWFIFLLDVPQAMLAIQLSAVLVGMAGIALYLRYLRVHPAAIVLAVVVFGYSVFYQSFNLALGSTYAWLPLVLLAGQRLFDKPTFSRTLALALSLSLCFLGGMPQYFFYICIVLFFYLSALALSSKEARRAGPLLARAGLIVAAFGIMGGLVAAQLAPSLELSLLSERNVGEGLSAAQASPTHSNWFSLKDMAAGYFERKPWNADLGQLLVMPYFGGVLLLIPFAFGSRRHRAAAFALAVALVYTVIFVLSKQEPALSIFGKLPLSDAFRNHTKMIAFGHFMIAALAAIGLSSILERGKAVSIYKMSGLRLVELALAFGVLAALFYYNYDAESFVFAGALFPLAAGVIFILMVKAKASLKTTAAIAVALLVLLDVIPFRNIREPAPAATMAYTRDPILEGRVEWLKEKAQYDRVLVVPMLHFSPYNLGTLFKIFNINSYQPMTLGRWTNFFFEMAPNPSFNSRIRSGVIHDAAEFLQDPQLLGLASLRYVSVQQKLFREDESAWKLIYRRDAMPAHYIYENMHALPRAYVATDYVITRDERESLRAMRKNLSRLPHMVVLENATPSFEPLKAAGNQGKASIRKYENDEVLVDAQAEAPSVLVLTDSHYPGWKAYVDGVEAPVWRANSLFRAVEVAAGAHTVLFRFEPKSLRWGIALSGATILLAAAGAFAERFYFRRRNRPRSQETSPASLS
jgi:hypothetical protein